MKEYYVQYIKCDGEECLVVLPSWRKLLWWFLQRSRHCSHIVIFTAEKPKEV